MSLFVENAGPMRKSIILFFTSLILFACKPAGSDPWKSTQLMEPKELAKRIQEGKNIPVIFNIGPLEELPGAIRIGAGEDESSILKLREHARSLSPDTEVVIYCGCCPFENCPNIRPAFKALTDADFKNHKLLNLKENLKVDWIDNGFPVQ